MLFKEIITIQINMPIVKKNSSYRARSRVEDGSRLAVGEGSMKTIYNFECYFETGTRVVINNTTYILGPIKKKPDCDECFGDVFDNHICTSVCQEPTTPNCTTMIEETDYIIKSPEQDALGLPKKHESTFEVVFERETEIYLSQGTTLHTEDGSLEFNLTQDTIAKLF